MYYTVIKHNEHLRTQRNVENMSQRWVFSTKQYFFRLVFRNGKIDDVVLGFDNLEGELTDHLKNNIWLKKLLKMPERSVILTISVTVKSCSMIQIFVNQGEKVLIYSHWSCKLNLHVHMCHFRGMTLIVPALSNFVCKGALIRGRSWEGGRLA